MTKNVYNAISLIRGIIGKPPVICWDAAYGVGDQTLVWTDFDACSSLLKEAEDRGHSRVQAIPFLEQAVALLERGELLEGEYGKWCYAFRKRAEDLFRQTRLTQDSFPSHPEQHASFFYADCGLDTLYQWEAKMYLDLAQHDQRRDYYQSAWNILEQSIKIHAVSERCTIETVIYQATAALG